MNEYRRTEGGVVVPERESRALSRVEIRMDDDTPVLDGYATVYDYRYDVAGGPEMNGFTELVARGAAKKSAEEADVRLLVNHGGVALARTKSGTMTLESDDIGLRVRAALDPSNPVVAELRSAMARGDLDEMSFGFRVLRDEWSADYTERTIREVKLYDVSLVTFPANPATVAQMRATEPVTEPSSTPAVGGRSLALARRQLEALHT
jgi:HK97 family phage prohead protease